MGGTIINIQTGYIDRSGIAYDMNKASYAMPPGWFMCDGYKEHATFNDAGCTIIWEGPWNSRLDFQQWVLGSVWIDDDGVTLHRDIPCQNPEKPWLYATDCELIAGQGAYVVNPNVVAPDGTLDGAGNPLALGMIMYQDQSGLAADSLSCKMAVTYRVMDFDILSDAQLGGGVALSTVPEFVPPASRRIGSNIVKTQRGFAAGVADPWTAAGFF